jgi:nucleotide-binding universal stress UspA family protein
MPGITVGVDGSGHSHEALEWAVKEAGIQGASLTVLTIHPVATNHWTGNPIVYPADQAELDKVRQAADEATHKAVDQAGKPGPDTVTVRAVNGLPARELIEASASSDLVVVGSRGGGGFGKLLLGSVSSQVVNHAACPVAVIRHDS